MQYTLKTRSFDKSLPGTQHCTSIVHLVPSLQGQILWKGIN